MPKLQKLRKYRQTNATPYDSKDSKSLPIPPVIEAMTSSDQPIEVKRNTKENKRQEKREKLFIKLGKIDIMKQPVKLSDLEASLLQSEQDSSNFENSHHPSQVVVKSSASYIKSNKMKKNVAIREASRMQLVQQHPSFIENPISAVKLHIEQMLAIKKASADEEKLNNNNNNNNNKNKNKNKMKM